MTTESFPGLLVVSMDEFDLELSDAASTGRRVFRLEGKPMKSVWDFRDEATRVLPLETELGSGGSYDALIDSVSGGLVDYHGSVVGWADADALAHSDSQTFVQVMTALASIRRRLHDRPQWGRDRVSVAILIGID